MTATGHSDLPDELGNAHADDVTGSGPKTATGHAESSINPRIKTGLPENESVHAEKGSGPKTATGHDVTAREKTATETMTAALHLSTANGKRIESESYDHGHESCPIAHELSYPYVVLDPKIGNHARITRGGGPPKALSIPHVVERAARNGENQPRKRSGQGESAANEQLPPRQLPKELKKRERARAQQTKVQTLSHHSRWTETQREGRKPPGTQHQVHHETPPEGRKEKRRKSQTAKPPEGISARGEVNGSWGTEPEGR